MKFDAVVFDFDGVMVESTHIKTWAFGRLYAKYGNNVAKQVVDYHLAHAGISRFVKFKIWQEEFLKLPYTEEDGKRLSAELSRLAVDAVVAAPCVPGAREFLETYYQKLPLYIASGTPEEELQEIIQRRKMTHFFNAAYGAPATKGGILKELLRQGGYNPDRVLMVGDALADWQGAKEAGTCFIGRVGPEGGVVFPKGTHLIVDLSRLPEIIEG